jgi:hypothetical protein
MSAERRVALQVRMLRGLGFVEFISQGRCSRHGL